MTLYLYVFRCAHLFSVAEETFIRCVDEVMEALIDEIGSFIYWPSKDDYPNLASQFDKIGRYYLVGYGLLIITCLTDIHSTTYLCFGLQVVSQRHSLFGWMPVALSSWPRFESTLLQRSQTIPFHQSDGSGYVQHGFCGYFCRMARKVTRFQVMITPKCAVIQFIL